MKMSFTIPQLFYDIIARVLPGFIFLLLLHFVTLNYNIDIMNFFTLQSNNFIISLGNSISFVIICYFIGTIFSSIIINSKQEKIKKIFEKKIPDTSSISSIEEMYQEIRLQNESAGFRLVKLRAEAKFLEVSRSITISYSIIISILIVSHYLGYLRLAHFNYGNWFLNLFANVLLSILFYIQEKPAWRRYYSNITCIYSLLNKKVKSSNNKKHIFHPHMMQ